jgi:hypothetical protein
VLVLALMLLQLQLPLRVVVRAGGERTANCVFATAPIPARAGFDTRLTTTFNSGDPMFARCYLPDRAGGNRPGDLVDTFFLDGKKWWTQAYDDSVPADALERPIILGEVLREPLKTLPRGAHRVLVVGTLRRGARAVKLYRGEFRYVR